jgi:hypothetical protein
MVKTKNKHICQIIGLLDYQTGGCGNLMPLMFGLALIVDANSKS